MKRSEVVTRATALLEVHGIMEPPVPVEQITAVNRIQVVRAAAEWSESGFLLRDGSRIIIGVNSKNAPKRQRFTIAHELGHWLLHEGQPLFVDQSVMQLNKRDDVSSQGTEQQEIEANQFAAELLMPRKLMAAALTRMANQIGSRDDLISMLAREFDVSTEAMGWRLINLGVLSSS